MRSALFAVAAGVALLGACSADEADFQKSAEAFIEGDIVDRGGRHDVHRRRVHQARQASKPGATFTVHGHRRRRARTWNFDLVVKDDSNFEITGGQPEG